MPETSTPTLTPDGTTKIPAFQNNNPGNVEVDALKAYILSQAGLANGLATLDAEGKLNASQIPVNLDDVLVYPSYASLPATGETGKLYITSDVNGTYYWNGTSYQILNQSFVRYRGSLSSLPSDPQPGDWFIAASSFSSYTSGHIYLYNGSSWDDVTAVFGQFVLKTDIAQNLGQQTDKVPSNKAVDDAINAISINEVVISACDTIESVFSAVTYYTRGLAPIGVAEPCNLRTLLGIPINMSYVRANAIRITSYLIVVYAIPQFAGDNFPSKVGYLAKNDSGGFNWSGWV